MFFCAYVLLCSCSFVLKFFRALLLYPTFPFIVPTCTLCLEFALPVLFYRSCPSSYAHPTPRAAPDRPTHFKTVFLSGGLPIPPVNLKLRAFETPNTVVQDELVAPNIATVKTQSVVKHIVYRILNTVTVPNITNLVPNAYLLPFPRFVVGNCWITGRLIERLW